MAWRILADGVVVLHLAFVAFVVLGGALVRWRRWVAVLHLPCAAYGAAIEVGGWICPLTPLENHLRVRAGDRGYPGGFVEHYLLRVLYPEPLTSRAQAALGALVVLVNVGIYAWALETSRRTGGRPRGPARRRRD